MEVQKHPHHVTHKKKWSEYLLEFFMLFLAVFLGFVAENIREEKVERHREKQLVISLANDIKTDINRLTKIITLRQIKDIKLDSLMFLLNAVNRSDNGNSIYFNAVDVGRRMNIRFTPDDGTMQQLKNAGGLRLISNRNVADSITQYDVSCANLVIIEEIEDAVIQEYRSSEYKMFNPLVFEQLQKETFDEATRPTNNPALLPFDNAVLNELNSRLRTARLYNRAVLRDTKANLGKAKNLLAILSKEYSLENE